MQIIPASRADNSAFGLFSSTDASSDGGFFSAMESALSAVSEGDNLNATQALAEENPALVEGPYSLHSTDGVTYTLEEVTFTKNELQELRKQLVKEGAPEETLKQFDILADQPDGATLAQVMASLLGKPGAGQFSDEDAHAITALLGQIDPSGTLAEDAIGFMRQGNGNAALDLIKNALAKMPADQSIEIDQQSLAALGRGLGLNADTMRQLANTVGSGLRLNGGQFARLMEPAQNQFLADAANAAKLDAALDKTLKPMIAKARSRMEKEQEAVSRESRRVQQSKVLIDQTVQQHSRDTLDAAAAGQTASDVRESQKAGGMVGKAGEERADAAQLKANGKNARPAENIGKTNAGNAKGLAENAKAAVNAHAIKDAKDFGDQDADAGKQNQKDAWQDLLGKTEVKSAPATSANTVNANSVVYSVLQGNLANQVLNADSQLTANNLQQLNQQLSQQVERGVLTAMRDGATRMDLQLHPAELGQLTITLIARNGEVSAQIRSEKSETAEMLSRQMETIRVNLEQQGLKVDKIEVQLENKPDQNSSFTDLGGHNARQEEQARRQEIQRMRNLAALRNEENSALAQGLHNSSQQARYAGNALHVVA